jgi:RAB protein geranylgeranyltransferase component A
VGKSVLHLDPNGYYASDQASLTLDELVSWASERSSSEPSEPSSSTSPYAFAQSRRYTKATTSEIAPILLSDRRRYALSLFPTILPSRGSLISTLIASDVSKYVGFRLLDSVGVWEETSASDDGHSATTSGGRVRKVPGSKEEVFKDKSISLVDKRRLMKFLMFVAGDFEGEEVLQGRSSLGDRC